MAGLHVKKGDRVIVLTGKDKGKQGEVLVAMPKENRVVVQGVNRVKRHQRPTASNPGGIVEKEAAIHVSNLAHIDPKDGKPCRVGMKIVGERKVRVSKRSGEAIDR